MYIALIIILLVVIFIEFFRYMTSKCTEREWFSNNRTNIIFSDYQNPNPDEKYALYDEEILVITQKPNVAIRKELFKYLTGPLNKYVALYARKSSDPKKIFRSSVILKITSINMPIIQTFVDNNILVNDGANSVNYYMRVLSDKGYENEMKINALKAKKINDINDCIALNKITIGLNAAISMCNGGNNLNE